MPNARLPMNHAREILRLSRERKMSGRAIAQSLSLLRIPTQSCH